MIGVRKGTDRGHAEFGWLDSHHTFSFGEYYDPAHMGFRKLRVINDDRVIPGAGFPTHPHRDMEIISYVVEGALEHKDSMGNGSIIRPGEVQRMSAGTGVTHSEFNPSQSEGTRFLQIWILPEKTGTAPGYEQKEFPPADRADHLKLVASRDGRDGSVTVHQDVSVYASILAPGKSIEHRIPENRHVWVQVVRGQLAAHGHTLVEGDGMSLSEERLLKLAADEETEFLVFDLA